MAGVARSLSEVGTVRPRLTAEAKLSVPRGSVRAVGSPCRERTLMDTEPASPDGMLADFVESANSDEYGSVGVEGLNLVLFVNGLTVSGELISGDQWAREHEVHSEGATKSGNLKHQIDFYEARRTRLSEVDQLADRLSIEQRRALYQSDAIEFLHLRNARVYLSGAGGTPQNGMLWRGRLSSVDGWAIGALEPRASVVV